MSELIRRLQGEHDNFSKLLALLDAELETLDRGENGNFRLMADIMDYMAIYPDVAHHPLEDRIFAWLVQLDPGSSDPVDELIAEHGRLRHTGKAFSDLVRGVVGGGITSVDKLSALGHEYVTLSRAHSAREESEIFPRLVTVLSDEDWTELTAAAAASEDPLFGGIVDRSYEEILAQIERRR
ncbi:MAG: hemerythrin domain-containing protein [Gammaproteobacteria bacterium]